jgi:hypothetical protein
MSHPSTVRAVVRKTIDGVVLLVALGVAAGASAQSPKGSLPDVPPPPKLSDKPTPADEEDATSVTIRQEGETKIEEFRTHGGRLYAVRVTPKIGKPYMLFDPDGREGEIKADELNGGVRPAQWTIFEF